MKRRGQPRSQCEHVDERNGYRCLSEAWKPGASLCPIHDRLETLRLAERVSPGAQLTAATTAKNELANKLILGVKQARQMAVKQRIYSEFAAEHDGS